MRIRSRDKKSVKTSDRCRSFLGLLAIFCVLMILGLGALPLEEPHPFQFGSYKPEKYVFPGIPHLSETDVINAGRMNELCDLPGIGPSLAEAVMTERDNWGVFHYPEDITAVKGIGAKKLEKLLPYMNRDQSESED